MLDILYKLFLLYNFGCPSNKNFSFYTLDCRCPHDRQTVKLLLIKPLLGINLSIARIGPKPYTGRMIKKMLYLQLYKFYIR